MSDEKNVEINDHVSWSMVGGGRGAGWAGVCSVASVPSWKQKGKDC